MEDNQNNQISSGSHSINLGQNNPVTNSNLHIGDVHSHAQHDEQPVAVIERVETTPLKIAGTPVQTSWLIVSGVVGFIGSLASIVGLWPQLSFLFVLLVSFAAFSLVLGKRIL